RVVVALLQECAEIGELQHALAAGLLTREQVHAELGDVIVGRRPGRTRADEITMFDSTGTALQDVAAAIVVYEQARAIGRGSEVKLDQGAESPGGRFADEAPPPRRTCGERSMTVRACFRDWRVMR